MLYYTILMTPHLDIKLVMSWVSDLSGLVADLIKAHATN